MLKPTFLTLFLLFGFSYNSNAQFGLAHEVGIIFGPVGFQSDYGQSNDLDTTIGNTGFGIGVVDYLNFSYNSNRETYFTEHFKVRSEISYSKTNLEHFGQWVDNNSNSLATQQLRAMRGSTQLLNLGMQLEYSPFKKIHDFENTHSAFSPYISLGAQVSYYSAKATSTLGEMGDPETTYPKYLVPSDGRSYGFSSESKPVFSVVSSVGARYKLSPLQDLSIDIRFQSFSSDWVDGLNPNKDIYTENKANDALIWLNFGYIFYLQ